MTRTSFVLVTLALALPACKKQHPVESVDDGMKMESVQTAAVPKDVVEAIDQMAYNFGRVHFGYDSDKLDDASKRALSNNVDIMQKFPSIALEVQGHADERGTIEYNLALGQRRAEAVRTYMTAMGIAPTRVRTVSYGEEVPVAYTHDETAWSENRRAEFRIVAGQTPRVSGTVN